MAEQQLVMDSIGRGRRAYWSKNNNKEDIAEQLIAFEVCINFFIVL